MTSHRELSPEEIRRRITRGQIRFGGNARLKIYGTLRCGSGKRMKKENRVFFSTEKVALTNGYRPCGHCMKTEYLRWLGSRTPASLQAVS